MTRNLKQIIEANNKMLSNVLPPPPSKKGHKSKPISTIFLIRKYFTKNVYTRKLKSN